MGKIEYVALATDYKLVNTIIIVQTNYSNKNTSFYTYGSGVLSAQQMKDMYTTGDRYIVAVFTVRARQY